MPMDDGPRTQVEGLRDRIAHSFSVQRKQSLMIAITQLTITLPWWFSLAITYYQPIARALLSLAFYKQFRVWTKVGAVGGAAGAVEVTRQAFLRRLSRKWSKGSASISVGIIVPQDGSRIGGDTSFVPSLPPDTQALEDTEALRRALGDD
jgi:hypothetical protein